MPYALNKRSDLHVYPHRPTIDFIAFAVEEFDRFVYPIFTCSVCSIHLLFYILHKWLSVSFFTVPFKIVIIITTTQIAASLTS